jgi:uncharacterized protein (TIGR02594 family)
MTAFELAQRFLGEVRELPGSQQHPFIQWCHLVSGLGPNTPDETPWCSSFANAIAWMLRLPRSKSAHARDWLNIGSVITLQFAAPGYDVVILKRGGSDQPGASVLSAQGHVGFYAGHSGDRISVLGGNQGDSVSIVTFPMEQVLGIRRLA